MIDMEQDTVRLTTRTSLFVICETSNVLLLIALFKSKKKLSLINKLFIYLTCIDITSFLIYAAVYICYEINASNFQMIMVMLSPIVQILGIFTFCTISVFRYWSLKRPLLHINTKTIYKVLGVELVLVIVLSAGLIMILKLTERFIVPVRNISLSIISSTMIFIVTVNTMSYVRLRKESKKKRTTETQYTSENNIDEMNAGMMKSKKRKRKAVKTLMIITFFYVVCSLPFTIDTGIGAFNNTADKNILYTVWMSNSGINAIIYLLRTKELRQYYIRATCSVRK